MDQGLSIETKGLITTICHPDGRLGCRHGVDIVSLENRRTRYRAFRTDLYYPDDALGVHIPQGYVRDLVARVPHTETEVEQVWEEDFRIDPSTLSAGPEPQAPHAPVGTTPRRFVRQHPLTEVNVALSGPHDAGIVGYLTTVGWTLPREWWQLAKLVHGEWVLPQPEELRTEPIETHGQIIDFLHPDSIDVDRDLMKFIMDGTDDLKRQTFPGEGKRTHTVSGPLGCLGRQVLSSFGKDLMAEYRKLSLDITGHDHKLTIHFGWSWMP